MLDNPYLVEIIVSLLIVPRAASTRRHELSSVASVSPVTARESIAVVESFAIATGIRDLEPAVSAGTGAPVFGSAHGG